MLGADKRSPQIAPVRRARCVAVSRADVASAESPRVWEMGCSGRPEEVVAGLADVGGGQSELLQDGRCDTL
jgi:hypothetical protein